MFGDRLKLRHFRRIFWNFRWFSGTNICSVKRRGVKKKIYARQANRCENISIKSQLAVDTNSRDMIDQRNAKNVDFGQIFSLCFAYTSTCWNFERRSIDQFSTDFHFLDGFGRGRWFRIDRYFLFVEIRLSIFCKFYTAKEKKHNFRHYIDRSRNFDSSIPKYLSKFVYRYMVRKRKIFCVRRYKR